MFGLPSLGTTIGTAITWILPGIFWALLFAAFLRLVSHLFYSVKKGDVAILEHPGRTEPLVMHPGTYFKHWMWSGSGCVTLIDCRAQAFADIKPVFCATRDDRHITAHIAGIYRVTDPLKAYTEAARAVRTTRTMLINHTIQVISTMKLDDIATKENVMDNRVKRTMKLYCNDWGIEITSLCISVSMSFANSYKKLD